MQKKEYEVRAADQRKRIDNLIRSIADHEKCETTRQAQNLRIDELKQRVKQLEYKEKWQWKALAKKRNDIQTQNYNLQKSIINQNKQLRTVLGNADEELQKKMETINTELETS
jgi:flagellar motility protein MotE (MotC chaperone)